MLKTGLLAGLLIVAGCVADASGGDYRPTSALPNKPAPLPAEPNDGSGGAGPADNLKCTDTGQTLALCTASSADFSAPYKDEMLQNIHEIATAVIQHRVTMFDSDTGFATTSLCPVFWIPTVYAPIDSFRPFAWTDSTAWGPGWDCLGWRPSQPEIHWQYAYMTPPATDCDYYEGCPDDVVFSVGAVGIFSNGCIIRAWIYGHGPSLSDISISDVLHVESCP